MSHILGIDPGATGGLAELDASGRVVQVLPMPMIGKEIDVDTLAGVIHALPDGSRVVVESVHSFPGQGVSSSFRFGFHAGMLQGVVRGARVPLDTVSPLTWMKAGPGATGGDKAVTAAWAGRTFPGTQIILPKCRKAHEGICDALGIAWYGVLKYGKPMAT